MTFWLVVIAIILILILMALEKGNSIKAAQAKVERERLEAEKLEAEELREEVEELREEAEQQREYDSFFAINGYPHYNDHVRIAAWGAKRGMSLQEAQEFLLDCEFNDHIGNVLDESSKKRIAKVQNHGWHATYVALAFTPEQRTGQDFRPIHGMIWRDDEKEKYYLSLTDLSAFADGGCSPNFPLKAKSIPQDTFTIEKEQKLEWNVDKRTYDWIDI